VKTKRVRLDDHLSGAMSVDAAVLTTGQKVFAAELTQELIYQITTLVRDGNATNDAAVLMGFSENRHKQALRDGAQYLIDLENGVKPNKEHQLHALYCQEIRKAEAAFRMRVVGRSLAPDYFVPTWVRDMTILERKDPANWGRRNPEPKLDESQYNPEDSFL